MDAILAQFQAQDLAQHSMGAIRKEFHKAQAALENALHALQRFEEVQRAAIQLAQRNLTPRDMTQSLCDFKDMLDVVFEHIHLAQEGFTNEANTSPHVAAKPAKIRKGAKKNEQTTSKQEKPTSKTTPKRPKPSEKAPTVSTPSKSKKLTTKPAKPPTIKAEKPRPEPLERKNAHETEQIKEQLIVTLAEIQTWQLETRNYSVAAMETKMQFVNTLLNTQFTDWEPREDMSVLQLIDQLLGRLGAFKVSVAQEKRRETLEKWRENMHLTKLFPARLVAQPLETTKRRKAKRKRKTTDEDDDVEVIAIDSSDPDQEDKKKKKKAKKPKTDHENSSSETEDEWEKTNDGTHKRKARASESRRRSLEEQLALQETAA